MKSDKKARTEFYLVGGNIVVGKRRTSIRLEKEMWAALRDVAKREGYTVNGLAGRIHRRKKRGQSFTSAVRVFLMLYYRKAAVRGRCGPCELYLCFRRPTRR